MYEIGGNQIVFFQSGVDWVSPGSTWGQIQRMVVLKISKVYPSHAHLISDIFVVCSPIISQIRVLIAGCWVFLV